MKKNILSKIVLSLVISTTIFTSTLFTLIIYNENINPSCLITPDDEWLPDKRKR